MKTFINILQKYYFLFFGNTKNKKEEKEAYIFLEIISQWLNKNLNYKDEVLIDYIINLEENWLDDNSEINIFEKNLFITNCFILLRFINEYEPTDSINQDSEDGLTIFVKDPIYYNVTKKIINLLNKEFLDEQELQYKLKNIRKNNFGIYSWKKN